MLRDYITKPLIANRYRLSLKQIEKLTASKDWPPAEGRIGLAKLYGADTVQFYFDTRVDGRTAEGRALKRRKRRQT